MCCLEDVGKTPGGGIIRSFLEISHNDDGTLKGGGGGSPSLSQVLAVGSDAGAQRITDLGAPSQPTDAATKAYVDGAPIGTGFYGVSGSFGLLLNNGIGNSGSWGADGGQPASTDPGPWDLLVDYVHVTAL